MGGEIGEQDFPIVSALCILIWLFSFGCKNYSLSQITVSFCVELVWRTYANYREHSTLSQPRSLYILRCFTKHIFI